ncbi:Phosphonate ABC transporter ATP-binding protein [gamma proteobacterium IMCC1989]|nr:Phosphonate ABC transporter ATP-binding protein [gamma proteobacterium IMCC1989]
MSAISVSNISKSYISKVLDDVSFEVKEGEMLALIGPSGSGKSTLMRHLSGLIKSDKSPFSHIRVLNHEVQKNGVLAKNIRQTRSKIGCIFQQFNLVNRLTVLTNVLIGCLGTIPAWRGYIGYFTAEEKRRALDALERVGLKEHAEKKAAHLSGGQQQRVAIARALMQQADIIFADEPIASLDPKSARVVMEMLQEINQIDGKTVIVTLHQVDVARQYCPRVIALRDGKLFFDGPRDQLTDELMFSLYEEDAKEMLTIDDPAVESLVKPAVEPIVRPMAAAS